MERYQYSECGIDNIYLVNGFRYDDTPRGKTVTIENLDGLHLAIGRYLIRDKKRLTGREFRFLRHELNLTQGHLAAALSVDEQTVARWEKREDPKLGGADVAIRVLYQEHIGGNEKITRILERLAELDELMSDDDLTFEEGDEGWQQAEAA